MNPTMNPRLNIHGGSKARLSSSIITCLVDMGKDIVKSVDPDGTPLNAPIFHA